MGLEYGLFRDDTKEAFHLGEGMWLKAFPSSVRHNEIVFKMASHHQTPEHLAKDIKRVYGPYFDPSDTDERFLAIARKLFQWCEGALLWMTHSESALWTDGTLEGYKLTADLSEPSKPGRKTAQCGKAGGEFGIGYDGGTGPLWDHVCAGCLPEAVRLLDAQITKWRKKNVSSYPSGIRVEVGEKVEPCDFDPTETEKVAYNPA
jgi:hypothetical protein